MIKHCREVEAGAAQGYLMGVMQTGKEGKDIDGNVDENLIFNQDTLLVTQTIPKSSKANMQEWWATMEGERQQLMDTNEIGFYVNSRMGLSFNQHTLDTLI